MTSEGWIADYADPFDFIDILLNGKNLHDSNNNNVAYFNDPSYNKKMDAAARLSGAKRYSTYGALDVDISKNAAPWAAWRNFNSRILLSKRVGCFTYNAIYTIDLAALCLK
jgi:ABC-type oligopeptide transport system substrate-binding subunit